MKPGRVKKNRKAQLLLHKHLVLVNIVRDQPRAGQVASMKLTVIGDGGLKLCVEEGGNPHGKTILFIHGFSHCHLVWRKQIQSRLARNLRLVMMDIRGHGLSESLAESTVIQNYGQMMCMRFLLLLV